MFDSMTATYEDVDRMIDKICWTFVKQFGGEYEDWRAEANLAYVRAYRRFDFGEPRAFTSYIWRAVTNTCLTLAKKQGRWNSIRTISENLDRFEHRNSNHKELMELVATLPDSLVDFLTDPIASESYRRRMLATWLRSQGRTEEEIDETFRDIEEFVR